MANTRTYESMVGWRTNATGRVYGNCRPPGPDEALLDWVGHALFQAADLANSGHGARSAHVVRAVKAVLMDATPLELIEAVLVDADRGRPPRASMGEDHGEGRYASLAITALEEAEGWERRRRDAARSRS